MSLIGIILKSYWPGHFLMPVPKRLSDPRWNQPPTISSGPPAVYLHWVTSHINDITSLLMTSMTTDKKVHSSDICFFAMVVFLLLLQYLSYTELLLVSMCDPNQQSMADPRKMETQHCPISMSRDGLFWPSSPVSLDNPKIQSLESQESSCCVGYPEERWLENQVRVKQEKQACLHL